VNKLRNLKRIKIKPVGKNFRKEFNKIKNLINIPKKFKSKMLGKGSKKKVHKQTRVD